MTTELSTREALMTLVGELFDYAQSMTVEIWPDSQDKISYDATHRLINTLGQYAQREAYYRSLAAKNAEKRAQDEKQSFSKTQRAKARQRVLSAAISMENATTWLDVANELETFCDKHGVCYDPFVPPTNAVETSDAEFSAAEKALEEARAKFNAVLAA
jgi:hypothetical protein